MNIVRWSAAAATMGMSLMNLPFVVDDGGSRFPRALDVTISLLGVVGIVAAIGLLRRARWGRTTVLVIGAVNLAGAVAATIIHAQGAVIGLTVSTVIVVLGFLTPRSGHTERVPTPVTVRDGRGS